jgi:hypothetical protein
MKKNTRPKSGWKMTGKKGVIGKVLFWLFIFLPVSAFVLYLAVVSVGNIKGVFSNPAIEAAVYETRLLYSSDCFAYRNDITGRVYTGTIDPDKMNDQVFQNCVPLDGTVKQAMAVQLTVNDGEVVAYLQSKNWDMNSKKVLRDTYIVNMKDGRPGMMTFLHKEGSD